MNPRFQPWSGRRRCPRRSASSAAQRRLLLRRPPPPLDLRPRREQPWVGNIKKSFPPFLRLPCYVSCNVLYVQQKMGCDIVQRPQKSFGLFFPHPIIRRSGRRHPRRGPHGEDRSGRCPPARKRRLIVDAITCFLFLVVRHLVREPGRCLVLLLAAVLLEAVGRGGDVCSDNYPASSSSSWRGARGGGSPR